MKAGCRALLAGLLLAAACGGSEDDDAQPGAAPSRTPRPGNEIEEVWRPSPGTTWQWQLQGDIDTSLEVEAYDVDLFDVAAPVIDDLHGDRRVVICYFSAGSQEEWREDAGRFQPADLGEPLEDWPGERWLNIRSDNVRGIMRDRLRMAAAKSRDAVEPDNVDAYENDSGFPLREADQRDYNRFLASEAHALGLSVGLKNALGLVAELEPEFDWALNEECLSYEECETLAPFLAADKAVFHVEYVNEPSEGAALRDEVCGDPTIDGFSTLIKTRDLDEWRLAC
jgi:hypothetical protein